MGLALSKNKVDFKRKILFNKKNINYNLFNFNSLL